MEQGSTLQEQRKELEMITCALAAMAGTVREAFVRCKDLPRDSLMKELHGLIEEIAFTAVREDETMLGRPLRDRKHLHIYQSTLTHLHIMITTMLRMVEEMPNRLGEDPFPEQDIALAKVLFTQQEMILCTLEEAIRSGAAAHLRAVCGACTEMTRLCRRSATEHEKCVEQGLCLPDAALRFLTILDVMRLLAHHEQEMVKLVVRWKRTWSRENPA